MHCMELTYITKLHNYIFHYSTVQYSTVQYTTLFTLITIGYNVMYTVFYALTHFLSVLYRIGKTDTALTLRC